MAYDPDLIITNDNRNDVVEYLTDIGYHAATLAVMGNIQLVNTYHREGLTRTPAVQPASELQRVAAQAVIDTIASMPAGRFPDEELVRYLAREEAGKLIEAVAPRRIEIVTPTGSIILEGTMHYCTDLVIRVASLGHAIMLVGPAGCGKTTIGEFVARALGLQFYITSTINETHELLGFVDGQGRYHSTPFRQAFEFGGLWIADEIDAWDASALLAANSALANGLATFPDVSSPVRRHSDFRMVATANTFGTGADRVYVGRNELDAASLDRFAVIEVDYDLNLERMFAGTNDRWLERVWEVRKAVADKKIRHVVSSRAIGMGAAALSVGISWAQVETIYLFKGMSSKDREKIDG
jgi:hypothetical protein